MNKRKFLQLGDEIVALKLSEEKFEQWEEELTKEASDKLLANSERLKNCYGNMTMKEILQSQSKQG